MVAGHEITHDSEREGDDFKAFSVGKGFYVFESTSTNQRGREGAPCTWTNIVRGV